MQLSVSALLRLACFWSPFAANLPAPTADSSALDNWHEATIILCVAIVGLIYLVSSRGTGGDKEKKPSLAEKHMT